MSEFEKPLVLLAFLDFSNYSHSMVPVDYDALNSNDNEVVLALQMFYITIALFGNLLIDLAYGLVDPRVRVNK